MPKVIEMPQSARVISLFDAPSSRVPRARTTADYRRLLSEMRLRPPSQRAFLRRLLQRASLTGMPMVFPVQTPAVAP